MRANGAKGNLVRMIVGVDHVQITVPKKDEAAAREFYSGVLGLPEIRKPANRLSNGGFWLRLGTAELHVGVEDAVDRASTKAHVGYRTNNLSYWRKVLTDYGIEISDSAPFPNGSAFEFRDPFGNRVELFERNAEEI